MAYTTVNKSSDYFNTKLYTGTGADGNAQTGVGFQPDFTWIKERSGGTRDHSLFDAVRGATKRLESNTTNAESTEGNSLQSFNTDGFTVGSTSAVNRDTNPFVAWNWKANGQGSSNTDGSINTTYTSANTTAGFSIVKYTGTGSAATVGHGLSAIPKMIIIKGLTNTSAENWRVFHDKTSAQRLILNDNDGAGNSTDFGANGSGGTITQNVNYFNIGTDARVNGSGAEYIAYCFAEKTGYSKFGSYTGNGNANGTFIYLGFKPRFFMLKKTNAGGDKWRMWDSARSPFNLVDDSLAPNENSAEYVDSSVSLDFLSNGCKMRMSGNGAGNGSGETYIYMAFGQSIVGSNNVPANAR